MVGFRMVVLCVWLVGWTRHMVPSFTWLDMIHPLLAGPLNSQVHSLSISLLPATEVRHT